MKTKICGITQLQDAQCAILNGAWALGFNFCKSSARCVDVNRVKQILEQLTLPIVTVGVFVEQSLKEMLHIRDELALDYMQVYQDYDCPMRLKQQMIRVVRPLTIADLPSMKILSQYPMVLIDAPSEIPVIFGGTGKKANWEVAQQLSAEVNLILAGGLKVENVADAIANINAYAVDVCSGIESSPGIKDQMKIKLFLEETRRYDAIE